jgi:hypothetical protein
MYCEWENYLSKEFFSVIRSKGICNDEMCSCDDDHVDVVDVDDVVDVVVVVVDIRTC